MSGTDQMAYECPWCKVITLAAEHHQCAGMFPPKERPVSRAELDALRADLRTVATVVLANWTVATEVVPAHNPKYADIQAIAKDLRRIAEPAP